MLNSTPETQLQAEYAVQEALLSDRIFLKYGVEKEEYNKAIMEHKLKDDPKVQRKLNEIDSMVDEDLKQKIVVQLFPQEEEFSDEERSYLDEYGQDDADLLTDVRPTQSQSRIDSHHRTSSHHSN